jgi:hypothetical protein
MSAANIPNHRLGRSPDRQNRTIHVKPSGQPIKQQHECSTASTDWFDLDARLRNAIVRVVLALDEDDD